MKILGAIMMIIGLMISIMGYGQYTNVACNCPAQITGQPFNCHCEENLPQTIGHIMTYVGIVIVSAGIFMVVFGLRKENKWKLCNGWLDIGRA